MTILNKYEELHGKEEYISRFNWGNLRKLGPFYKEVVLWLFFYTNPVYGSFEGFVKGQSWGRWR